MVTAMDTITSTTTTISNSDHPPSSSSQYTKHIRDYDALRYRQLRYIFGDYEFMASNQWKGMQMAGWTYANGIYKSPLGTRQYENVQEMRHALDVHAVRGIGRYGGGDGENGECAAEHNSNKNDDSDLEANTHSQEPMKELRNDICYSMQLLLEQKQPPSRRETTGTKDTALTHPSRNRTATARRMNTSSNTATSSTSSTAIELGADLYLHRKQRKRTRNPTTNTQPPLRTRNPTAHTRTTSRSTHPTPPMESSSNNAISSLPHLPTPMECSQLMSTWDVRACAEMESMGYVNNTIHTGRNNRDSSGGGIEQTFQQWRFLLFSTHHSLLLYGNGSKYDILSRFGRRVQGYFSVQIDGYDTDVTMERIFDLLVTTFLNGIEPESKQHHPYDVSDTHRRRAATIGRALHQFCIAAGAPLLLILHGFDGHLSTHVEQEALAALIRHSSSTIRLVVSVDHVDSVAGWWSTATWNHCSWALWNISTHRPYVREMALWYGTTTTTTTMNHDTRPDTLGSTKAVQRRWKQQSRATEQSERVLQVLHNLAPRYGEVMQILAQLQLSEMPRDVDASSSPQVWVDYKAFRAACKSRFVIDKDSKLRALQTELSDHHLLVSKNEGSTDYVRIPYSIEKLQEIISYQRNADI